MQVHHDINNLPFFRNAVITIGTFDGVHTGHLQIISQLKKEAALVEGETVIITFDPHPRMVISAALSASIDGIKLLNTLEEKIELLQKHDVDHLVIIPFTLAFAEQSAEEYISDFLVSKFHPHSIVIGYDHRFGKKRKGDYKLLEHYQSIHNFIVKEIPGHVLDNVTISSTRIRHALSEGEIDTANECLGYAYFFGGTVAEGNKLGRTLGYPTANIEINDVTKLIPANGVYAVQVSMVNESIVNKISGNKNIVHQTSYIKHLKGMMNIGFRPTVDGTKKVIEVNIFDFDKSIYHETIRVYVKYFLRSEIKFDGLDALKNQLASDKAAALNLLNES